MFASLALVGAALAAADTVPQITATRIASPAERPAIDGRLDEPVWQRAQVASGFVQWYPDPGQPATQPTEARVLYDDDAIYVGMWMRDAAPDSIVQRLARRDPTGIYSDWAHVIIDSYHDNRTAFRFAVNPAGVKKDAYHFDDTGQDVGWDAVWEAETQVDSTGWTAEYRIPLSQLRFTNSEGGELVWGINFAREIARRFESSFWSEVEPNAGRYVSYVGELRGLRGLGSPRRLEVQPYTLTRYQWSRGLEGPRDDGAVAALGADVKYGLTSNLTLTATLNPDFGQVEADPSEVNLTAFETFFPERRPFFVEGTDIFKFGLGQVDLSANEQLFYSRRIGRLPQRLGRLDALADAPEATTILGAAKLSGKTAGWSLGVLAAVTGEEHARVLLPGGDSVLPVEPPTGYAMARASRQYRQGRTAVGGVLTAVRRDLPEDGGLDFLHETALAAGVDGRHRWGGNRYEATGWVLASRVAGSMEALALTQRSAAHLFHRPDADHLELDPARTSLAGTAAHLRIAKIGGGDWRWSAAGSARSPGFEVNDLGFLRLADAASLSGSLAYARYAPSGAFLSWTVGTAATLAWTWGGERTLTAASLEGSFELTSYWTGYGSLTRFASALSPTVLRGGPALFTPARTRVAAGAGTDPRKPVRVGLDWAMEREDDTGGRRWSLLPLLTARTSRRAEISIGPLFSRNVAAWQYLTQQDSLGVRRYHGAHLVQRTAALTARLNYTFSPDLTLQLYGQPFVSAGRYTAFRDVGEPRAAEFGRRFVEAPQRTEPDFNVQEFDFNAVLRWEYRPGSALFVVWSQTREQTLGDGSFGLRRDLSRLFGWDDDRPAPSTNVLLVKVSYWLDR
ncbi:MAG TPA: DUF5916 domain-containing protein [Longimicrobium sp.]|nr:DUF5916 domain-containing protein [Longimicrobium sp.]